MAVGASTSYLIERDMSQSLCNFNIRVMPRGKQGEFLLPAHIMDITHKVYPDDCGPDPVLPSFSSEGQQQISSQIVLSTDKPQYRSGESVVVLLRNTLGQEIVFEPLFVPGDGSLTLWEKVSPVGWREVLVNYARPGAYVDSRFRAWAAKVRPGETFQLTWDQMTVDPGKNQSVRKRIDPGVYRIGVQWYYPQSDIGDISYSNEFRIEPADAESAANEMIK